MENKFSNVLDSIKKLLHPEEEKNLKRFGRAYLPFQEYRSYNQSNSSTPSYSFSNNTVFHLPRPYFMDIEFYVNDNTESDCCFSIYTPDKTPLNQRCAHILISLDDFPIMHQHDYIEIIYVFEGRYAVQIENKKLILEEKEMCIMDMNCAHLDLRAECTGIVVFFGFRISLVDDFFIDNLNEGKILDFFQSIKKKKNHTSFLRLKANDDNIENIENNMATICLELELAEKGYDKVSQINTIRIFNCLEQNTESYLTTFPPNLHGIKQFNAIAEFIDENISSISPEKLCNKFHYNVDYYNRIIRKHTGLSFTEYVRFVRLEKAKHLLTNTDMTISDIISQLGYTCHSYFFKIFRNETHMTPQEYRDARR